MVQNKQNYKEEYVLLIDLLAKAINAIKLSTISNVDERERLTYAHNLANKFLNHATTILYLLHGTFVKKLPSFPEYDFIDSASIDVLTRAEMEAFLVFHLVFYAPKKKEEKDFRYWSYLAAGLAERQNLPEEIDEYKQLKEKEKGKLNELRNKMDSNLIFNKLKDSQKKQIFDGKGRWRWKLDGKGVVSWREIAIDAELGEWLALHMYSHLSGSAHSGYLNVLQTEQALVKKETDKLIIPLIGTMNIFIANMLEEYCQIFPRAQEVLEDSGVSRFVHIYVELGRRLS